MWLETEQKRQYQILGVFPQGLHRLFSLSIFDSETTFWRDVVLWVVVVITSQGVANVYHLWCDTVRLYGRNVSPEGTCDFLFHQGHQLLMYFGESFKATQYVPNFLLSLAINTTYWPTGSTVAWSTLCWVFGESTENGGQASLKTLAALISAGYMSFSKLSVSRVL